MLSLDRPLVILDLEATGTDPDTARIIQVAAKRIMPSDGGVRRSTALTEIVNPGVPVDAHIRELTGITQEELDNGSPWPTVADRLGALIEDADLAGYNILNYDLPLLEAEYSRLNREVPGPGDRTVVDALALEKQLRTRTLEAVYERRCGEPLEGAHDAAADVKGTLSVLVDQSREVLRREIWGGGDAGDGKPSPADLADFARGDYLDDGRKLKERDDGAVEVCFGKHSGRTLQDLYEHEKDYFSWMYETMEELRPHIDEALGRGASA
jgi:DNA polymerase-3 subunit epsilon